MMKKEDYPFRKHRCLVRNVTTSMEFFALPLSKIESPQIAYESGTYINNVCDR